MRNTKQRQAILEVLESKDRALSAAEIHACVPHIDLATIYRNLEYFTKQQIVRKLHLGTKEAHFEYTREPHHHAVCTECERVVHFTAPDAKLKKLLKIPDFQVDELEVTVRGICHHKT